MKTYWINLLIAFDQLLNALIAGNPRETISSRCHKRREKCRFCAWLCKILDSIDENHCAESREQEYPYRCNGFLGYLWGIGVGVVQIGRAVSGLSPDLPLPRP